MTEQLSEEWLPSYLEDKIYNDLMRCIDGYDLSKKYISQWIDKFKYIILRSPITFYEIDIKDLTNETIKLIEEYTIDCTTQTSQYEKLNGIMPDVIARISRQAEHKILSNKSITYTTLIQTNLNSTRELVSFRWKFIGEVEDR